MKALFTARQTSATGDAACPLRVSGSGERFALAAVILLHLALVIPLAATLNLWIDEAYTLRSTDGGLVHAVRRALGFELQPPLYFVLLTLWRTLDDSAFFARLFSILCTAATVVLAGSLARRYLRGVPPALVAAAVAFNPLTVYAAVEARFYAPALLLSALLLLFFHDGYVAAVPSPAARRWHTALAIVALYTHYFLGFLLAGGGVALLLLRRGGAFRKYLVGMAATAVLFAPLAVITVRQVASVEATGARPQTIAAGSTLVWYEAWRQLLPVRGDSPLANARAWASRLALPLALLAALARRRRPTVALLVPITLAAVVAIFFAGIAVRLGPDAIRPEHTTVLYLPVLLAGLALLQYAGGVRAAALGGVASLLFAAPYLVESYAPLANLGDWIRVSHYVERHETASQPILVFKAEFALSFGYHYSGRNRLVPLPAPPGEERYDPTTQVLWDEDEILQALSGQLGADRRFWLVTSQTQPFRGIDFHPEILEGFVARRCTVLRDRSFVGSRVRLLELRPLAQEGGSEIEIPPAGRQEPVNTGRV